MVDSAGSPGASTSTGLHVRWTYLTIALFTIAVGSLGTLVVVASVQNVDTLSTVALALAVVAFAAQLIVSLAQANASAQQIAQSERINADTQAALVEIRVTGNALLANQKDLVSQLLRAVLPRVARQVADEAAASADGPQILDVAGFESRLSNAMEGLIDRALKTDVSYKRVQGPSGDFYRLTGELEQPQFVRQIEEFKTLSRNQARIFHALTFRLKSRLREGDTGRRTSFVYRVATWVEEALSQLADKSYITIDDGGISKPLRRDGSKMVLVTFTDAGFELARAVSRFTDGFPDHLFSSQDSSGSSGAAS